MNVLVACEESQRVAMSFRDKGHYAFSCDVLPCSGGHPEYHIQGDALGILNGGDFVTMDGRKHHVDKWDLLIAHPPCTYLSKAGAVRLFKKIDGKSYAETERLKKGLDAKEFFMAFYNADIDKIAVENPVPSAVYKLPKYTQIIEPYFFGDPYYKKTCLWLKGVPPLEPTNIVQPLCSWVTGGSKKADGTPRDNLGKTRNSKLRSKTFWGVAKAMADQWG
jgi:hypothetical protein